jgi:transposase
MQPIRAKRTVGLDWAQDAHAVCVVNSDGEIVDRFEARHDRRGLDTLVRRLKRHGEPSELPVAIERPSGLLVDTLMEEGFVVVPIHPNVVKACRSRYSTVRAKSDPGDAHLLADLLRTDGHRFEPLLPLSDEVRALRAMVRGRDDLVAERIAVANQLRSLLDSYWPGAVAIFSHIDSSIALDFVQRYPTPDSAASLGEKRLARFLAEHRYTGGRTPAALLERLRAAPQGLVGELEVAAKRLVALRLVATLRTVVDGIKQLSSEIEEAVARQPAGRVIMSFPRAGKVNAAQILSELGDDPARFGSEASLAAQAGVAPITYASGKKRGVGFRWAANKRLRVAITTWADNSRHSNEWAAGVYRRARQRGCDHPHAVRILARAWIRVLWRCWVDGVRYDPEKHLSAQALKEA